MKVCPKCGMQLDDNAMFCSKCGTQFSAPNQQNQQNQQQAPVYAVPAPVYDPYDHTSEFDPQDISDNKVFSMLVYLMGAIGIIIALLAANNSKYAAFHVRQALKFTVVEILMWIAAVVTAWLLFIPVFAAAVMSLVFTVIKIICFFQICSGKAKEPAIIRSLKFLK